MQRKEIPRGSSYVRRYDERDEQDVSGTETRGDYALADGADDGRSIIGVSLGPEQTRLAAPNATDEQKTAALSHVHNDAGIQIEENDNEYDELARILQDGFRHSKPRAFTSPAPSRVDAVAPPSPWRAGPRTNWSSLNGASDRSEELGNRQEDSRRFASNDDERSWKRFIPNLPSIAKGFTGAKSKPPSPARTPTRSHTPSSPSPFRRNTLSSASAAEDRGWSIQSKPQGTQPQAGRRVADSTAVEPPDRSKPHRPPTLRRSTSDGSLHLQRSLSRASSLGDDSRWADVHEQVNSRAKAIRDAIADSNLRLPRLPDLPSFSIGEALADFQTSRKRSTSLLTGRDKRNGSPSQGASDQVVDKGPRPRHTQSENTTPPGTTRTSAEQYPNFTRALKYAKGDVVVLGGYRGSVLRSADPPYRQQWVPVKVGLGLRKVNLEVGLDTADEENMEQHIKPSGMLKNIGPIDISRRLFKRLTSCKNAQDETLRVWDFGYDWRLSPHRLSAQLIEFLEQLPCNASSTPAHERGATVIAHSLGGLITRHVINQRPQLVSAVLYAGVPQTCVNILGPLRNGDDVLLSSRVLTAQVNFSIRTSFALLPTDGKCFFNKETNERFDVDFFDPKQWEEHSWSPCIARPAPVQDKTQTTSFSSLVGSMSSALPSISLPARSRATSKTKRERQNTVTSLSTAHSAGQHAGGLGMQMDFREEPAEIGEDPETTPSTAVTISKKAAMDYLKRTLAEVKQFKEELAFKPDVDYPPAAVIYGKSTPTVYGACVKDREAIKRADAYDNLAFASGDGVVLARASQLPEGYKATRGGVVSSDRGHISLLGDLEAVGRCLNALHAERKRRLSGQGKKFADKEVVEEDVGTPTAGIE